MLSLTRGPRIPIQLPPALYAGAYAFGPTTSKVSVEDGRKRVNRGVRRPMAEWDVLLKERRRRRWTEWGQEVERRCEVMIDEWARVFEIV